jgi:hypothetical protein
VVGIGAGIGVDTGVVMASGIVEVIMEEEISIICVILRIIMEIRVILGIIRGIYSEETYVRMVAQI